MLKKSFTVLALLVFISGVGFSQQKPLKAIHIDPNSVNEINNFVDAPQHYSKPTSDQLIFTEYDYAGNNSIPNMVYMYDFTADGKKDLVAVAMQRFDAVASSRKIKMIVGNRVDGFTDFEVSSGTSAGWGSVQVGETGPLSGKAIVLYHRSPSTYVSTVDMTTLTPTFGTATLANLYPEFVYLDNGTILATTSTNPAGASCGLLYKSTDQGVTWSSFGSLNPTTQPYLDAGLNLEYTFRKSPNGNHLFTAQCWGFGGNGGLGGVAADSADFVGIKSSTDQGSTWQFELLGKDGLTPVFNRTGYYPIFENFAQMNGAVDNNGVKHVTINGYAYRAQADTGFAFPALYWNSRDKHWIALTSTAVELDIDANPGDPVTNRPGNGIGNAYPVPCISTDGSKIVVLWQGPEYSGTPGSSTMNFWTPTATDPTPIVYTDLYYAYSIDGGVNWSAPALVPNASRQHVQESYPCPNNLLEISTTNSDSMIVNFLYMIDDIPGTSLFATNNTGNNNSSWNYERLAIPIPSGINDGNLTVNSFELSQNYPNPFNPSTKISYTLAEKSNVSIKVFDVLGREVADLLNTTKDAGSHEVVFDASNLASGLYVYMINAGSFTASKKMMLMK